MTGDDQGRVFFGSDFSQSLNSFLCFCCHSCAHARKKKGQSQLDVSHFVILHLFIFAYIIQCHTYIHIFLKYQVLDLFVRLCMIYVYNVCVFPSTFSTASIFFALPVLLLSNLASFPTSFFPISIWKSSRLGLSRHRASTVPSTSWCRMVQQALL